MGFLYGVLITVLVIAALLTILYFVNRTAFSRIWAAGSAQVGKASKALWSADPVAVYQAEVDNAAEEIAAATQGLAQYQGLVARLKRQVEGNEKDIARLNVRVDAEIRSGNDAKAQEYLVQLKKAQTDLAENQGQLRTYEESYQQNLTRITKARAKIAEAKRNAEKLDAELKMSRAEAEAAKLAEKFNVRAANLEGLAEVEDEIRRQIDVNRGQAKVAMDIAKVEGTAGEEDEEERVLRAEAAAELEQRKKVLGLKG
ncbi:MAG: PspA/IM30 family protein [Gemmataceae bacterium]|nr:PspA/IM30 family protein [Gemmataceae bacterium]